mgnify:FL=1
MGDSESVQYQRSCFPLKPYVSWIRTIYVMIICSFLYSGGRVEWSFGTVRTKCACIATFFDMSSSRNWMMRSWHLLAIRNVKYGDQMCQIPYLSEWSISKSNMSKQYILLSKRARFVYIDQVIKQNNQYACLPLYAL